MSSHKRALTDETGNAASRQVIGRREHGMSIGLRRAPVAAYKNHIMRTNFEDTAAEIFHEYRRGTHSLGDVSSKCLE